MATTGSLDTSSNSPPLVFYTPEPPRLYTRVPFFRSQRTSSKQKTDSFSSEISPSTNRYSICLIIIAMVGLILTAWGTIGLFVPSSYFSPNFAHVFNTIGCGGLGAIFGVGLLIGLLSSGSLVLPILCRQTEKSKKFDHLGGEFHDSASTHGSNPAVEMKETL